MRKSFFSSILILSAACFWSGVSWCASTLGHLGGKLWSWMSSVQAPQLPDWSWLRLPEPLRFSPTGRTVRPLQDQRPHIQRFRLARNDYSY